MRKEQGPSTVMRPRVLRSHSAATTSSSLPIRTSKTDSTTKLTKKQKNGKNGKKNTAAIVEDPPAAAATTLGVVASSTRSSRMLRRQSTTTITRNNDNDEDDVCDQEYNREEYAKTLKKDFRQSTPQELSAWKKKNASSTTTYLSKAPQNVQDEWKKIKQICDDCPSEKLDVWVDGTYLLLVLMLLLLLL